MYRFGKAFEFGIPSTQQSVGGGSPPVAVTWDPANKNAVVVLSNGNLTATMTGPSDGAAVTTTAVGTGPRAYKFVLTDWNFSSYIGLSTEADLSAWASDSDATSSPVAWMLQLGTGSIYFNGDAIGAGPNYAEGAFVVFYHDRATGDVWVDSVDDTTAADREAGTNPTFSVPDNTALFGVAFFLPFAEVFTLDPTYSSGRFGSLNP